MEADRTELHDLAAAHPERVADMARQYAASASRTAAARVVNQSSIL